MISSYLVPTDPDLDVLLSGILADLVILKNGHGEVYWPEYGINQIGDWAVTEAYQVYMSQPATLVIGGSYISITDTPLELGAGWNLIAYHRDTGIPVADALASIHDQIVLVKDNNGNVYWPEYGINQIGDMLPGQGYKVYLEPFAYPVGDLDHDCDVDTVDLDILQAALGSFPGDENWNPVADLDNDSDIDIFDYSTLVSNFGQLCTAGER